MVPADSQPEKGIQSYHSRIEFCQPRGSVDEPRVFEGTVWVRVLPQPSGGGFMSQQESEPMGQGQSPHSDMGMSWMEGELCLPQPGPSCPHSLVPGPAIPEAPRSAQRPCFPPLLHFPPRRPPPSGQHSDLYLGLGTLIANLPGCPVATRTKHRSVCLGR